MKKQILPRLLALAVTFAPAVGLAQQPPSPTGVDEGKAHFARGVALFRENDFRGALVEFHRSYDVSHNFKVLYNIGQTELELQDYAGARGSFQKYLTEGGAEIDGARRASVDEDIKKLAARVARVEVKANLDGAEVLVDDVVVGKTPLKAPVVVSIGRRKITLQKRGVVSTARFVDVAGGDAATVSLELAGPSAPERLPSITPPTPVPVPPPPPPPPPPSHTGMWIGVAATGALMAGTVVAGGLAVAAHSDAQTKLATFGVKATDVDGAHSKASTLALVTDILGGVTIAMAGVTIALGVTGGSKKEAATPRAYLTVGPRGALLTGRF